MYKYIILLLILLFYQVYISIYQYCSINKFILSLSPQNQTNYSLINILLFFYIFLLFFL